MRRASPFKRDFEELHGRGSFRRAEIVQEQPLSPKARVGFALVLGSLGLFWTLFFLGAAIAMTIVGGVFVWALFTARPF